MADEMFDDACTGFETSSDQSTCASGSEQKLSRATGMFFAIGGCGNQGLVVMGANATGT